MTEDNKYYFHYFPGDFRLWDPKIITKFDKKQYLHEGKSYYLPFEHTICLSSRWNWFQKKEQLPVRSLDELQERSGEAILFVAPRERGVLHAIERATRQTIVPLELPTIKQVNAVRVEKFKKQVLAMVEGGSQGPFREVLAELEREHGVAALDHAAALARMAHGDGPFLLTPPAREGREDRRFAPDDAPGREDRRFATDDGPPPMRGPDVGMATFRVEVGHAHGVRPGNLVGAIANEAQLDSKRIGKIQILDEHTLIDLPEDLDPGVLEHLKTVWCAGQQLRITRDGEMPDVPPQKYSLFQIWE